MLLGLFSENKQEKEEEIINKFLDDININETEKLIKKEIAKHNYNPIELFHLNLPNNALKLINTYRMKCDCRKCDVLHHIMFVHKDERWSNYVKPIYFFGELYKFPEEDELKKHFKIGRKYKMFCGLFQRFHYGKSNIIRMIEGRNIKYSVEKSLKEFNEIIKFIYEHNYNKFEDIKLYKLLSWIINYISLIILLVVLCCSSFW